MQMSATLISRNEGARHCTLHVSYDSTLGCDELVMVISEHVHEWRKEILSAVVMCALCDECCEILSETLHVAMLCVQLGIAKNPVVELVDLCVHENADCERLKVRPEIAMQHSPTQTGSMSVHGECVHEQTKRVDPLRMHGTRG